MKEKKEVPGEVMGQGRARTEDEMLGTVIAAEEECKSESSRCRRGPEAPESLAGRPHFAKGESQRNGAEDGGRFSGRVRLGALYS